MARRFHDADALNIRTAELCQRLIDTGAAPELAREASRFAVAFGAMVGEAKARGLPLTEGVLNQLADAAQALARRAA